MYWVLRGGSFDNPPPGGLYLGPAGPIPDPDAVFRYVSRDADGDGVPGARMIDGPFAGFSPNFNLEVIQTTSIAPVSRGGAGSGGRRGADLHRRRGRLGDVRRDAAGRLCGDD